MFSHKKCMTTVQVTQLFQWPVQTYIYLIQPLQLNTTAVQPRFSPMPQILQCLLQQLKFLYKDRELKIIY
jgi:hypothetical protein